jgi:hypothetical protein
MSGIFEAEETERRRIQVLHLAGFVYADGVRGELDEQPKD